jgi:ribosomal protein S18 acetylase RimI-like enzyme
MHAAATDGFTRISLSVDPQNSALRLYESEGFSQVGESGTSWTLTACLQQVQK